MVVGTMCHASSTIVAVPLLGERVSTMASIDNSSSETNITSETDIKMLLHVPYVALEVIVAILAIIGNALVIYAFCKDRRLRRLTNYYIVALAVADFFVGCLGIPFAILSSLGLPRNLHLCLFTTSLLVMLCTISIFCLVAVSLDRYWAILYPLVYSRNMTSGIATGIIIVCWVLGTVVGLLPLFGWNSSPDFTSCLFVKVMDYNYLVFLYFATIIFPALVMALFYILIYRVVIRQLRQITILEPRNGSANSNNKASHHSPHHSGIMLRKLGAAHKREVKAAQNLSVIVSFFMICWIPLYTINCVNAFCRSCLVPAPLLEFFIVLSHANSAVNPILYAYHLKDFRIALKVMLCPTCLTRPRAEQERNNAKQLTFSIVVANSFYGNHNSVDTRPRTRSQLPLWQRPFASRPKPSSSLPSLLPQQQSSMSPSGTVSTVMSTVHDSPQSPNSVENKTLSKQSDIIVNEKGDDNSDSDTSDSDHVIHHVEIEKTVAEENNIQPNVQTYQNAEEIIQSEESRPNETHELSGEYPTDENMKRRKSRSSSREESFDEQNITKSQEIRSNGLRQNSHSAGNTHLEVTPNQKILPGDFRRNSKDIIKTHNTERSLSEGLEHNHDVRKPENCIQPANNDEEDTHL